MIKEEIEIGVVMLSLIMLSVIILSVIMKRVMAPNYVRCLKLRTINNQNRGWL